MSSLLDPLRGAGVLSDLDVSLAETLCRLGDERGSAVMLATAFASRAVRLGNVCLDLARLVADGPPREDAETSPTIDLPRLEEWEGALRDSALLAAPNAPLVLDRAHRLYLRRY